MRPGAASKTAAIYAVFGITWIAVSDRIAEAVAATPHQATILQTYKGWVFVLLTTVLIYGLMRRYVTSRDAVEREMGRANDAIEQSLREKETLAHELRHRVKNNLQSIVALVNISGDLDSPESIRYRVFAMALAHELALSYEDVTRIPARDFVVRFASGIESRRKVSASVRIEPAAVAPPDPGFYLTINHAVPIGMYLHEVLSAAPDSLASGGLVLSLNETAERLQITSPWHVPAVAATLCEAWASQAGGTLDRGDATTVFSLAHRGTPTQTWSNE